MMQAKQMKDNQSLNKETKEQAFKLILILQKSPQLLQDLMETCLVPLMNQIVRKPRWNYQPVSGSRRS